MLKPTKPHAECYLNVDMLTEFLAYLPPVSVLGRLHSALSFHLFPRLKIPEGEKQRNSEHTGGIQSLIRGCTFWPASA
jgi:hypothetical protein